MNICADPGGVQRRPRTIPVFEDGDREVPDIRFASLAHESAGFGRERLSVTLDDTPPLCVPLLEMAEANAEHGRLQLVQPRVLGSGH